MATNHVPDQVIDQLLSRGAVVALGRGLEDPGEQLRGGRRQDGQLGRREAAARHPHAGEATVGRRVHAHGAGARVARC